MPPNDVRSKLSPNAADFMYTVEKMMQGQNGHLMHQSLVTILSEWLLNALEFGHKVT